MNPLSPFPAIPDPPRLEELDRERLGAVAWAALGRLFSCPPAPGAPGDPSPGAQVVVPEGSALLRSAGVFVTIHRGGELRGCLGSVEGQEPLLRAVERLTVQAATRDRRFAPVLAQELGELSLEISILGPLVPLPEDRVAVIEGLRPDLHGVLVRLGPASGLLLPQVARRHGWSPGELLAQVCRKARLPEDAWRQPEAQLLAFRVTSFQAGRGPGGGAT